MKKLFILAAAFSATLLSGCVTPQLAATPFSDQSQVINFPGQKQAAIFDHSKIWIAKAFTDANSVIQYADKEQGSIVGKGNVPYPVDGFNDSIANGEAVIKFTMKIDTKDDKARITFSNATFYRPASVSGGIVFPATETPLNTDILQQRGKKALDGLALRYKSEVMNQAGTSSDW